MFVDPHTHHHLSNYSTLEVISSEGYEAVVVLAYIPIRPSHHTTLYDLFNWLLTVEPERFNSVGIKVYVGLGIHPRNIPEYGLEYLMESLEEWLSRANVVGEVGLETGSDIEVRVLSEILKVASKLDKVVVIHTPRRGKEVILKKLRDVLVVSPIQLERLVVDHASADLIHEFLKLGTYVGLTVQPGKLSVSDIADLTSKYPELFERGMVNSDCGRDPSDPLAVKRVYSSLRTLGVSNSDALKLVRDNALRLFK